MPFDRRGRRRQPDQGRGLRPLHPRLPKEWLSRSVRMSMSEADWERFDHFARVSAPEAPTQARAYGAAVSRLLQHESEAKPESRVLDWMDWERRKTLRLLFPGR